MTLSPGTSLDMRLQAALSALDTAAGFDERVMARVREESDAAAADRAARARLLESNRHRAAQRAQSWRAWGRRIVTLDTVGMAVLACLFVRAIWTGVAAPAVDGASGYVPQILIGIGILLALSPLVALHLERARRRFSFGW